MRAKESAENDGAMQDDGESVHALGTVREWYSRVIRIAAGV
jgi:hypothetical protein